MRSIIEEIADAERRAEEIVKTAAVQNRELLAQTREQAEQTLVQAEAEEKSLTETALGKASEQGEAEAAETLAAMEREADDLCGKAKAKLDGAVRYLVDKVQSRA
jgi:vacuolar-type H+-ATPase subunit H